MYLLARHVLRNEALHLRLGNKLRTRQYDTLMSHEVGLHLVLGRRLSVIFTLDGKDYLAIID